MISRLIARTRGELGRRLKGDVYLDYAAAGLYTDTQIDAHARDLKDLRLVFESLLGTCFGQQIAWSTPVLAPKKGLFR